MKALPSGLSATVVVRTTPTLRSDCSVGLASVVFSSQTNSGLTEGRRNAALLPLSGSQCSSPLPDNLGLNGAAAFGAVKQENGEDSQELSAASILFCRLLELCSVVAQRAHCDATLGRFFLECKCFLEGRGYGAAQRPFFHVHLEGARLLPPDDRDGRR
jgi:hypothetical protein